MLNVTAAVSMVLCLLTVAWWALAQQQGGPQTWQVPESSYGIEWSARDVSLYSTASGFQNTTAWASRQDVVSVPFFVLIPVLAVAPVVWVVVVFMFKRKPAVPPQPAQRKQ